MRTSAFATLAVALVAAIPACSSGPPPDEIAKEIATLTGTSTVAGEALVQREAVARFYKARRSRPAWAGRSDDILQAIRSVEADGLDPETYHQSAIRSLLEKRSRERTAEGEAALDVLLADAVAGMADNVRYGRVRPKSVNPAWNVDPRDDAPALDSVLTDLAGPGSIRAAIDARRPNHFIYKGLMTSLAKLREIEAAGGWPAVPTGKSIKPGAKDRRIPIIRRRLRIEGEYASSPSRDSTTYDRALERAVQVFQSHHRLDSTGVINASTLAAMNVSAQARVNQVRANLERARWVLGGLGDDFMLVNLPAFKAYLIRGDRNVWESRTQIGEEAMQTPTFSAKIRTIVFNPDWTVPPTILANEIIEGMRNGTNPIDKQGLVIYDANNEVVDPSSIDWDSVTPESFQYTLRQPAGEDNALGKVKFLFPNKYSIYLHDTPSRHLFDAERRTFSHGCIRIEHPLELAEILLNGQDGWGRGRIDQAVGDGKTENVALDGPLPILIVYWTVSVGASGEVRYAQDIYDLDPPLVAALDRTARSRSAG